MSLHLKEEHSYSGGEGRRYTPCTTRPHGGSLQITRGPFRLQGLDRFPADYKGWTGSLLITRAGLVRIPFRLQGLDMFPIDTRAGQVPYRLDCGASRVLGCADTHCLVYKPVQRLQTDLLAHAQSDQFYTHTQRQTDLLLHGRYCRAHSDWRDLIGVFTKYKCWQDARHNTAPRKGLFNPPSYIGSMWGFMQASLNRKRKWVPADRMSGLPLWRCHG